MEQLLEFAGNHALLVGSFTAVLTALIWHLVADPGGKNAVDPLTATAMINHEEAVILDVRSIKEFGDGHIVNAINIPLNGLGSNLKQLEKADRDRVPFRVAFRLGRVGAAQKRLRERQEPARWHAGLGKRQPASEAQIATPSRRIK